MGSGFAEFFVKCVEFLVSLFLMAEDLYNFLAVYHFLDVAVDSAESLLLCDEATSAS